MKTYFIASGDQQLGPYTISQMRSMWLAGSIHGQTLIRDGQSNQWVAAAVSAQAFEPQAQAPAILSMLFGYGFGALGILGGGFMFLSGLALLSGAKNAMNESTAAIFLVGGAVIIVLSAFGALLVGRK